MTNRKLKKKLKGQNIYINFYRKIFYVNLQKLKKVIYRTRRKNLQKAQEKIRNEMSFGTLRKCIEMYK